MATLSSDSGRSGPQHLRGAEQGPGALRPEIRKPALVLAGLAALAGCTVPRNPPESQPPAPQSPVTLVEAEPSGSPPVADGPDIAGFLEQRLADAQAQAETEGGDCAARLTAAQRDYEIAVADPRLDLLIPDGRTRLANIEYRLHLGRASCGAAGKPRGDELLAAAAAAQKAVSLYRAQHDYQPMAVMQYDLGAAYRLMGDTDKAVSALQTAIAMDVEFGFAEDAEDNAKVLQGWTGKAVNAAWVNPAIPKRSITLKFAWAPRDAEVSVAAEYLGLEEGRVAHGSAATRLVRHIRADGGGWLVSSEVGDRHYNFADWHDRSAGSMVRTVVAQAAGQMWPPDARIGGNGDFGDTIDQDKTAAALADDIDTVGRELELPPEGDVDLTAAFGRSLELLARPDGLRVRGAEDYTLAVSAWIDATLDQGVWYEMTAPLLLPGIATPADHDIRFAYARPVPCSSGDAEAKCAEILVRATPDPDDLGKRLDYVKRNFRLDHQIRYQGTTDLRLVVDPARLLPYASETRRHWYLEIDGGGEPFAGTEKVTITSSYR